MKTSSAWKLAILLFIVALVSFGLGYQAMLRFLG